MNPAESLLDFTLNEWIVSVDRDNLLMSPIDRSNVMNNDYSIINSKPYCLR